MNRLLGDCLEKSLILFSVILLQCCGSNDLNRAFAAEQSDHQPHSEQPPTDASPEDVGTDSDSEQCPTQYYALCIAASCSPSPLTPCKEPDTYSYTTSSGEPTCTSCGGECGLSVPNQNFDPYQACGLCYVFYGPSLFSPQWYNDDPSITCDNLAPILRDPSTLTPGDTVFSTYSTELVDNYAGFAPNLCTVEGAANCMGMQCTVLDQEVQLKTKQGAWATVPTAECDCVGAPSPPSPAEWPVPAPDSSTEGGGGNKSFCENAVWSTGYTG